MPTCESCPPSQEATLNTSVDYQHQQAGVTGLNGLAAIIWSLLRCGELWYQ